MNLLVDIGNARIKWALFDGTERAPAGQREHRDDPSAAITGMLDAAGAEIGRVVVANVAGGQVASALAAAVEERWGVEAEFLEARAEQLGVRNAYANPAALGIDRWAAAIAAFHLGREAGGERPVCAIDAGTAATFDAVDARGRHLGGLILPGRRLLVGALAQGTSDIGLAPDTGAAPEDPLGRTTDAGVVNAAWLAIAAGFDRAAGRVERKTGARPLVFVTGGDGETLLGWLETDARYRADLVLEGLALLAGAARRRGPSFGAGSRRGTKPRVDSRRDSPPAKTGRHP